ncbi:MAG: adenine methylase [Cyanobacteria bacterium RYN_339]|nr:adenine methylase [Cyanobacteria bacterium RYN_339]
MRYVMYNDLMTPTNTAFQPSVRVKDAAPFVKWVGGKRALLPELAARYPARFNRYFEPFLGGGAVFFHLQPERAILADFNAELVETYTAVRDEVDSLIRHLADHRNDEDYYYALRAQDPAGLEPLQRASRLIYLNRTCFNGLYRVNARGGFNVPFGKHKNPTICNEPGLRAASLALQGTALHHRSYAKILDEAAAGDFVYFDPPYHPRNTTSNFTSYTAGSFSEADQAALRDTFRALADRGCKVMLSNSDTPLIRDLYADFHVEVVMAPRFVNRDATKRGPVSELVVRNYRR